MINGGSTREIIVSRDGRLEPLLVVINGIAAPFAERADHFITPMLAGPKRIVDVQANFIIALVSALLVSTKMGEICDPDDAIEWNVLVIHED